MKEIFIGIYVFQTIYGLITQANIKQILWEAEETSKPHDIDIIAIW